jgi:hypothetical protein
MFYLKYDILLILNFIVWFLDLQKNVDQKYIKYYKKEVKFNLKRKLLYEI